MGILNFLKGQLLEIIEWNDDSRDTLSFRFPDDDKEIKRGAQLIVRESQIVQFVYLGEFGDTFGPGKHTLTTDNIPILSTLKAWKYGFESPFKADVYFVNTRLFTGNKWGTSNPVMMRDDDFGIVRVRAFGTYDFQIVEPRLFLKEVAGTDQHFRLDEFADTMRSRIVSVFSEALATAKVPVLDVASRYSELGEALLPLINPVMSCQVRHRDDQLHRGKRFRAARGRASHRQAFQHVGGRQPERLREVPDGPGHGERRQAAAWRARPPRWRRPGHGPADDAAARRRCDSAAAARILAGGCPAAAAAQPSTCSARRTPPSCSGVSRSRCPRQHRRRRLKGQEDRRNLAHHARGLAGFLKSLIMRAEWPKSRALKKFHCPACGAEAQWNPAKQALVCPFCGTTSPAQIDRAHGRRSVSTTSSPRCASIPETTAAGRPSKTRCKCQSCQAISVFEPGRVASVAISAARPPLFRTRRSRRHSAGEPAAV